ncbi:MAG: OmcA/MtrC family decaheme c-type cytochrome [Proteobacteria bacterium]|nr:OmcA/MtrC family decaheme c-type cytochrome [Pseudomonadota bacterium]MDA1298961.1 OmcA/MtrC family decaheme c-type cytochrome [Pseudomonadota bacterium]
MNSRQRYGLNRIWIQAALACCIALLVGCGGGGGTAAPDVAPGPAPSNGNPPAPDPVQLPAGPNTYETASEIIATITDVTVASPPVLTMTVVDGDGVAITGLRSSNVRFTIAKLIPASNGDSSHWQSYINRLKTPNVHPENDAAIQATSESGGTLTDNGDGTYSYQFVTDITNVTAPMAVPYEPLLTHRVAIQFSGGPIANPVFDWIPATGQTMGIANKDVVATASCNRCHDPIALHGGGRVEVEYCVTCHNPGTTEPNSETEMDLAVLVHKIHMGASLPSVQAGGEYVVYGFRDSRHDYSHVVYPQNPANCTKCHAGTATAGLTGIGTNVVTQNGDNWTEVPTIAACGSCHDDVDFASHRGGQSDNSGCRSCHSVSGIAGSPAESHRDPILEAMAEFNVSIESVSNTAPGENPLVTFSVTDENGSPYDLATDPGWSGASLNLGLAWNTQEFVNTGNGQALPSYARTNLLSGATSNGDGTYSVVAGVAIPDGTGPLGYLATGSGMATIEGRARKDIGEEGASNVQNIPFVQPQRFFSIDEPNGQALARREIVDIARCNACHGVKVNHGSNRSNNINGCAGCHNPRNTDLAVRPGQAQSVDGKREESIHFKTLIHGLHASGVRESPLVVYGFRGSVHVFDEEHVQYPGTISNCLGCHVNDSYELPLPATALATTVDTGADGADPSDDIMVTPVAATCSSCHDGSLAIAHMEQNGGDFSATQATISSGASTETCTVCHGPGRTASVSAAHGLE